ncbi:hypothetical protein [Nocardiopsis flavescens]
MRVYNRSKIAFGLFGLEPDRRSRAHGRGGTGNLAHPGAAPASLLAARPELGRGEDTPHIGWIRALSARGILLGALQAAALPVLTASDLPDARPGVFYSPSGLGRLGGPPGEQRL